jgi:hypothetical protein
VQSSSSLYHHSSSQKVAALKTFRHYCKEQLREVEGRDYKDIQLGNLMAEKIALFLCENRHTDIHDMNYRWVKINAQERSLTERQTIVEAMQVGLKNEDIVGSFNIYK